MWTRCVLIPSRLLLLLLPLILVSCSGGGTTDAPSSSSPAPAQAGVIWERAEGMHRTLLRSQTDGSEQVTLADEPEVSADNSRLVGSTVLYHTDSVSLPGLDHRSIWRVELTGTGRQALAQNATDNILRDVVGPWVIYDAGSLTFPTSSELASVRLDGTARRIIAPGIVANGITQQANYERSVGGRVVFEQLNNLVSLLPDGTDRRELVTLPRGPQGEFLFSGTRGAVGSQVIYIVVTGDSPSSQVSNLLAVPVTGGPVTTLATSPGYIMFDRFFGAVVGARVVYLRCPILPNLDPGPCDVYSVRSDGTSTLALSTHPDNDVVQGVVGARVIVRRSHGGPTDELYSISADGQGGETALLTLSYLGDFVLGVVGERVIIRRGSSLWSIRADGSGLVQLTSGVIESTFDVLAAGEWACFDRTPIAHGQRDLWCVPADGSGPAQPVATTAADEYFVTAF
jgi:hypothetical protein